MEIIPFSLFSVPCLWLTERDSKQAYWLMRKNFVIEPFSSQVKPWAMQLGYYFWVCELNPKMWQILQTGIFVPTDCFMPMDVAIAVDNSDAVTSSDFDDVKRFVKQLIRRVSNSENNIHFSLLEYSDNATVLTDFRQYRDQLFLENLIDNMAKRGDSQRRVDIALERTKEKIFSLEGGMRQGYPRFLIFVTSADTTADFSVLEGAGKELRDLGVTFVAIGTNRNVPDAFLQKLAGDSSFIYKATQANELSGLVLGDLNYKMCKGKRFIAR